MKKTNIFVCASTGTIIAGSYCAGVPWDVIHNLYCRGKQVFIYRKKKWYQRVWKPKKFMIPRFDRDYVLEPIHKNLTWPGIRMGNVYQHSGQHLMIATVNKNYKKPMNEFIKSWGQGYKNYLLVDAIRNSFAAAIYFGNYPDDRRQIVYGDGGQGDGNNPIIYALASVFKHFPDAQINLLNIGTGWYNEDQGYQKVKKQGGVKRATKVLMMARDQSMKTGVYFCNYGLMSRDKKFGFVHIDRQYPVEGMDKLDGTEYIRQYRNLARKSVDDDIVAKVKNLLG